MHVVLYTIFLSFSSPSSFISLLAAVQPPVLCNLLCYWAGVSEEESSGVFVITTGLGQTRFTRQPPVPTWSECLRGAICLTHTHHIHARFPSQDSLVYLFLSACFSPSSMKPPLTDWTVLWPVDQYCNRAVQH